MLSHESTFVKLERLVTLSLSFRFVSAFVMFRLASVTFSSQKSEIFLATTFKLFPFPPPPVRMSAFLDLCSSCTFADKTVTFYFVYFTVKLFYVTFRNQQNVYAFNVQITIKSNYDTDVVYVHQSIRQSVFLSIHLFHLRKKLMHF